MKVYNNFLPNFTARKSIAFSVNNGNSHSKEVIKPLDKVRLNEASQDTKLRKDNSPSSEEKDHSRFDFSLIKGSAYESIFQKKELNFSNMSLNELHDMVRTVNDMERDYAQKYGYGNDEPIRLGKSGNPIISQKREAMNTLDSTLEILSYGGGDIDPNKNIDVIEYFSNRAKGILEDNKENVPQNVPSSYMRGIFDTLKNFVSDSAFEEYKDKAALLLNAIKKVDDFA